MVPKIIYDIFCVENKGVPILITIQMSLESGRTVIYVDEIDRSLNCAVGGKWPVIRLKL